MQLPTPEPPASSALSEIAPKLAELSEHVLFGDIWERPGLSKRDRSLITIAALTVLTVLYHTDQLRGHIARGHDNGLSQDEIIEAITQMAFYGGWACPDLTDTQDRAYRPGRMSEWNRQDGVCGVNSRPHTRRKWLSSVARAA
ncbi:MAG: carboxymuconolactone decarboxylase family protein, partial [Chloroflexi bacterium]